MIDTLEIVYMYNGQAIRIVSDTMEVVNQD